MIVTIYKIITIHVLSAVCTGSYPHLLYHLVVEFSMQCLERLAASDPRQEVEEGSWPLSQKYLQIKGKNLCGSKCLGLGFLKTGFHISHVPSKWFQIIQNKGFLNQCVPVPGLVFGESSSSLDLDPGTTTMLGDPGLASRSDTVIGRGRSSTLCSFL